MYERKATPETRSESPASHVEKFADREKANEHARNRLERYKQQYKNLYPATTESYCLLQLCKSRLWLDGRKRDNGIYIWVERNLQSSDALAEFESLDRTKMLPKKAYCIRQTLTSVTTDTEGYQRIEKISTVLPGALYTDIVLANNDALATVTNLLRPKTPNMDHVASFNRSVPTWKDHCDSHVQIVPVGNDLSTRQSATAVTFRDRSFRP